MRFVANPETRIQFIYVYDIFRFVRVRLYLIKKKSTTTKKGEYDRKNYVDQSATLDKIA